MRRNSFVKWLWSEHTKHSDTAHISAVCSFRSMYRAWEAFAKVKQLEERFAGVATDRSRRVEVKLL